MADLYRVGRALLALVLVSLSALAHASYPATPGAATWQFSATVNTPNGSGGQCFPVLPEWLGTGQAVADRIAACQRAQCVTNSQPNGCQYTYTGVYVPFTGTQSPNNSGSAKVTNSFAPGNVTYNHPLTGRLSQGPSSCSDSNSTLDPGGETCTCNAPNYVDNDTNNGCVLSPAAQTCELAAQQGMTDCMQVMGSPTIGSSSCSNSGCSVEWESVVTYTDKTTGQKLSEGHAKYTGTTCTGNPEGQATKDACPGGVMGVVNGAAMCVNFDPNTNVIESVKKGTVTSTVTPSTNGGTGTGTTTTATGSSTTCGDGKCTTSTTTTTTNPDGTTKTETTTSSEPQADYCNTRPRDPACVNSTFSGSCGGSYSCTGDAVMCAAARAVNQQRCDLMEKDSPEAQLYASAKGSGTSTFALSGPTTALSSASFDSSNALGVGAACIPDLTVTVWGKVVVLPFAQVCPSLEIAGQLMLAISFLLAIRIVGRG